MLPSKQHVDRFMQEASPPVWVEVLFLVAMIVSSLLLYFAADRYMKATEKKARMERFIELEQKGQVSP